MLKAEGLSYKEIGERLGWTYTKVNRAITEGRRRFLHLYEELETGVECERLAPTLHALAQGTASSEATLELRPHLRNCAGCRATVRALHTTHLGRLSAFATALIAPARAIVERLKGSGAKGSSDAPVELHPMDRQADVDELFRRLNGGESAVQPVAPSVAEGVGRVSTVRVNVRDWAEAALQRLQSSDLAIGIHAASTGGGGRISSIAALIGICVSGVGAGTYCVATALLPDPKPAIRSESKTAKRKATEKKLVRLPAPASQAAVRTPTPTPTRAPATHHVTRTAVKATPKSHEQAPISPAQAGTQDFSFEQTADPAPVAPAAAPATGGGEFEP